MDDNTAERLTTAARRARRTGADQDEHSYWGLLDEAVRADGGAAALRVGTALLTSADPLEREVGCDLLSGAADLHAPVRGPVAEALTALARTETEAAVLGSLATGLGRTQDPRVLPALLRLARHEDADLRFHVAVALGFDHGGRPDGEHVRTLIRLTGDEDADVRNWAVFSLGCQLDHDTPAVRAALWRCAADEDAEVRQEAARCLARRHAPGAVELVARLLAADGPGTHLLEAAEILGDPALLPALRAHGDDAGTEEAVAACDPARRARTEDDAWALVLELERRRPGLGAALHAPRHDSVHCLRVTVPGADEDGYSAADLLERAAGDPARAAGLLLAELAG
ncbi:HEAT repeat domain-containing protein [Kitasatospora sp. NPDC088134]|uniref:HEAT repeat domain-containing protein n=1 Tax=Kitasatospora sp. NPDC088134 TaxID=3364071 RepID=UPI003826F8E2